jgi:glycopeptide antibiotics resistance protein
MNKSVITPIVGFIALVVQWIFNIDISEEVQSQIADFIINGAALGAVLYGIFKNHFDKQEKVE